MEEYVRGGKTLGDTVPGPEPAVGPTAVAQPQGGAGQRGRHKRHGDIAQLLPAITVCHGQRIASRRVYIAYYPGVVPGIRTTGSDVCPELGCKLAVVRWAWNHHTRITGKVCPYDLSSANRAAAPSNADTSHGMVGKW